MNKIEYVCFNQVHAEELITVLNKDELRTHLIDHPYFDDISIQGWVDGKIEMDRMPGCRIRVVLVNGEVAGWCGIQPDENGFEIAIVISKKFWGLGTTIFRTMMVWANELGHKEVLFHLLDSRPEYKALSKMATNVHKTELSGRCFITYHISVT